MIVGGGGMHAPFALLTCCNTSAVNAAVKDLAASAAAVKAATPQAFAGNGPPRPGAAAVL